MLLFKAPIQLFRSTVKSKLDLLQLLEEYCLMARRYKPCTGPSSVLLQPSPPDASVCLLFERRWWIHKVCWNTSYRSMYISSVALAVSLSCASAYTKNALPSGPSGVGATTPDSLETAALLSMMVWGWACSPGVHIRSAGKLGHQFYTVALLLQVEWMPWFVNYKSSKTVLETISILINRTTPEKNLLIISVGVVSSPSPA